MVRQRPKVEARDHVRISIYLTAKERKDLNEAADIEGQSLSLFCAEPIKRKVQRVLKRISN